MATTATELGINPGQSVTQKKIKTREADDSSILFSEDGMAAVFSTSSFDNRFSTLILHKDHAFTLLGLKVDGRPACEEDKKVAKIILSQSTHLHDILPQNKRLRLPFVSLFATDFTFVIDGERKNNAEVDYVIYHSSVIPSLRNHVYSGTFDLIAYRNFMARETMAASLKANTPQYPQIPERLPDSPFISTQHTSVGPETRVVSVVSPVIERAKATDELPETRAFKQQELSELMSPDEEMHRKQMEKLPHFIGLGNLSEETAIAATPNMRSMTTLRKTGEHYGMHGEGIPNTTPSQDTSEVAFVSVVTETEEIQEVKPEYTQFERNAAKLLMEIITSARTDENFNPVILEKGYDIDDLRTKPLKDTDILLHIQGASEEHIGLIFARVLDRLHTQSLKRRKNAKAKSVPTELLHEVADMFGWDDQHNNLQFTTSKGKEEDYEILRDTEHENAITGIQSVNGHFWRNFTTDIKVDLKGLFADIKGKTNDRLRRHPIAKFARDWKNGFPREFNILSPSQP